jgi:hypothetical protein
MSMNPYRPPSYDSEDYKTLDLSKFIVGCAIFAIVAMIFISHPLFVAMVDAVRDIPRLKL